MKTDLTILIESSAGGVFRCHASPSEAMLEAASRNNFLVVPVRLHVARDKNGFLNAIAKALQFPDYFGRNWDALYDCLLELKHEDSGLLLLLREASGFARADPEEFAAAVDTLADAADYWKGENRRLLVVVELATSALAPELPEISCPAA